MERDGVRGGMGKGTGGGVGAVGLGQGKAWECGESGIWALADGWEMRR